MLSLMAAFAGAAGLAIGGSAVFGAARADEPLIHYNANTRDYWEHPPADWYMGDENAAQHGERPYPGQPLPTAHDDLVNLVKENIKLQPGFRIEVLASGLDRARQMVFGDDGTLYAGCWTDHVFALKKQGDKWVSKIIIKGLRMPTGIGFYHGALYVADIDKIYKYPNIDSNQDNPKGEVVYSDFPPYTSHGWKYMVADRQAPGWFYIPVGPPCSECLPPSGTAQVPPHQSRSGPVGGCGARATEQRRRRCRSAFRAALVLRERSRLDGRQPSVRQAQSRGEVWTAFRLPVLPSGRSSGSNYNMGHKCDEFTPPALNLGAHMAPLGMKF